MGTAAAVNRRKYHGLLIASTNPPVERLSALTGLDEEVEVVATDGSVRRFELATHRRVGGALIPEGAARIASFEKTATTCRWTYDLGGARLVKELRLGWRVNTCAVRYTVEWSAAAGARLRLAVTPRISLRDFHSTLPDNRAERYQAAVDGSGFRVTADSRTLVLRASGGRIVSSPSMLQDIWLDMETERHQNDTESLFSPGRFEQEFAPGTPQNLTILGALAPDEPDATLFDAQPRRKHLDAIRSSLLARKPSLSSIASLIDAADDFLVHRVVDGKPLMTVIAGYPWFADWGRDTMISMVGLMIATGRHDDARGCLETFARYVKDGMIPNHFDDYGGPPHYNTVDASLWFLHACGQYLSATSDRATFRSLLLPACLQIIEKYQSGTHFGIKMDPADGLIMAGDEGTQLTWMDAKRDGVVFTPRHGKPVEISALWHHGLLTIASAISTEDAPTASRLRSLAVRVASSFRGAFWNDREQRLHDCLRRDAAGRWTPVPEVRPNQIFAASLEHSPLDVEQRRAVIENVRREHLTPVGLRTLSPRDPGYRPRFEGDMMSRDGAYHNGTVWPWLLGPFCEAVLRAGAFNEASKSEVRSLLQPLLDRMSRGCLGQLAEVYDAEEPRREQGCVAQAWSVAEAIRIAAMVV